PPPTPPPPPAGRGGGEAPPGAPPPPVYVPPDYVLPNKDADVYRTKDGKRHIIIGIPFDEYYDSTHKDISANPSVSDPEVAQMRLDKVRELETKYNVFIEYVNMTWDGIMENIPISIMSGVPDADVYRVDTQISIPAVLNNMAVGLEDLELEGTDVFAASGNIVMESLKIPGQDKTYLFRAAGINQGMYMLGYNRELIGVKNLTDPQELWDRGEWTWEVFREYCRELTDPSQDIYGWSGYWTNFLTGLLFSNNTAFAAGPVQTLDDPKTLQTLSFISDLYNVDRTARPWNTGNWEINNNLYAGGQSGFWISAPWLNNEQGGSNLPFEFGMVPFPIGPSGSRETFKAVNAEGNYYFIPRFIQNPREVYDVIYDYTNWFNGDLDYRDDLTWLKDSVVSEENFRYYMEVCGLTGFDLLHNIGVLPSLEEMVENIDAPAVYTPAQYAETYKQVFQDALDNYFK
ncbi:MAG: extracellular solute-binding protein, partial [Oscillospiraceae bacterium]|nr:extracellular solute-binding protein [Oscillospiraceae bacterium]